MPTRLIFCNENAYYYFNINCNEKLDHSKANAF